MDYDKFMKHKVQKCRLKPVVSPTIYDDISWDFWQELAEMTKDINYQCNFDKNGLCKSMRSFANSNIKCCCMHCGHTIGYLSSIPDSKDGSIEREIINLFNETNGFWRKGKGCILPRKYRSGVCLLYMCEAWKVEKTLSQTNRMVLRVLNNTTQYYPDYVKLLKEQKIRSVNDFIDTIISEENSIYEKGGI